MQLYNKLSAKERAELIEKAGDKRITLSFYKYHLISNTSLFRDYLFQMWECLDVLGRIYIASEGINAQLSMPSQNFEKFKNNLDNIDLKLLEELKCKANHLIKSKNFLIILPFLLDNFLNTKSAACTELVPS